MTLIPRDFFARPSVPLAPELLGLVLERETDAGLVAVELTEVEAYAGASDPASHAYRGKTARNAVMFGPPGHAYVYFTYGMHFCVNLVCLGNGSASAVLLRAGRIIAGEELARTRRTGVPRGVRGARGGRGDGESPRADGQSPRGKTVIPFRDLARGPARLCQALDIDRSLDGADVCAAESPLRMRWPDASTTARSAEKRVLSGPRVGVSQAAELPWRFWIEGEPTVSVYRPAVPRRRKLVTP
ncbi:MAG TPA: DNA-3-methyladenine glycosylase [Streptosporangiaceae bacterium]|nr:DNA-3-methyladenine glycosylase [Streptosporangiaceae bacterium]